MIGSKAGNNGVSVWRELRCQGLTVYNPCDRWYEETGCCLHHARTKFQKDPTFRSATDISFRYIFIPKMPAFLLEVPSPTAFSVTAGALIPEDHFFERSLLKYFNNWKHRDRQTIRIDVNDVLHWADRWLSRVFGENYHTNILPRWYDLNIAFLLVLVEMSSRPWPKSSLISRSGMLVDQNPMGKKDLQSITLKMVVIVLELHSATWVRPINAQDLRTTRKIVRWLLLLTDINYFTFYTVCRLTCIDIATCVCTSAVSEQLVMLIGIFWYQVHLYWKACISICLATTNLSFSSISHIRWSRY